LRRVGTDCLNGDFVRLVRDCALQRATVRDTLDVWLWASGRDRGLMQGQQLGSGFGAGPEHSTHCARHCVAALLDATHTHARVLG
jgi:hypothetical protein